MKLYQHFKESIFHDTDKEALEYKSMDKKIRTAAIGEDTK